MSGDIKVDTQLLNEYARRIEALNKKLTDLESRLKMLYFHAPVRELLPIIKTNTLTNQSRVLKKCSYYLRTVSTDFERKEKAIAQCSDILEYEGLIDSKSFLNYISGKMVFNNTDSLAKKYVDELTCYGKDKVKKYVDSIKNCKNWEENIVSWYSWFMKDMYGDFDTLKSWMEDIYEEYTFKKPELLPKNVSDFFDVLSDGKIAIEVSKELKKYYETKDGWTAYQNISFLLFDEGIKELNKWLDKKMNLKYIGVDKKVQNILISTICEMPQNFIEGIKQYAKDGIGTAGSIFIDTTLGAITEATAGAAAPVYNVSTALAYPVVDQVCEALGYDLSAQYEELRGKTGLDAVFASQKELWVDIVYKGVKEKASAGVDKYYETVNKGWEYWKTGIKTLF